MNPYTVGIAQNIAGLELYSGTWYRTVCFVVFQTIAIIYVLRYAKKIEKNPKLSVVYGEKSIHEFSEGDLESYSFSKSDALVIIDIIVTLVILMLGLMRWEWDYPQLCGLFLIMSMVAAGVKKWSPNRWCSEFIDSAKTVVWGLHTYGCCPRYSEYLELDLASVVPSIAGPKRPQ